METEEFRAGVDRLLRLSAETGPTAIMCAELVWWRCHRGLISDFLKVNGFEVIHIINTEKDPTASIHACGASSRKPVDLRSRRGPITLTHALGAYLIAFQDSRWKTIRLQNNVGRPGLEPGTNALKGRCSTD